MCIYELVSLLSRSNGAYDAAVMSLGCCAQAMVTMVMMMLMMLSL